MYWAFKLFIHRSTCPIKIHSLEEPSPWLSSAISWPLTRVQFLLSFWWIQFYLIKKYYLYIFLCAYPTIPHWPTHFVLKLAILLFVLSFNTHSKIPKKKKKKDNPISLKYVILFINCGAYWNLTFIWSISQYCEHCHYLTAIYSFDSLI